MKRRLRRLAVALGACLLGAVAFVPASRAADVPFLSGRVVDEAGVVDPAVRERIEASLRAHEERTTDQVVVLTVSSLEGESVEGYAERVFATWKLGRADKDNGALVVVATGDRKMRIEVGYGLEGALTDGLAGSIIRNVMAPRFKAGDYGAGIEEGTAAILQVLSGNPDAVPRDAPRSGGGSGDLAAPDMPWYQRVLLGAFIFGIIGLFTVLGVLTPRAGGWFLYAFLIPFWAMFPIVIVGAKGAFALLATYLVAYPLAKLAVRRKPWYRKAAEDLKRTGTATIGGVTISGGGFSAGGGSSGGGGFSGGGGSSGGGGASGSW